MDDIKNYKVLTANKFPKPFDKKGAKIRLTEKRAADYVKKGVLEALDKIKPEKATKKAKKAVDTDKKEDN